MRCMRLPERQETKTVYPCLGELRYTSDPGFSGVRERLPCKADRAGVLFSEVYKCRG